MQNAVNKERPGRRRAKPRAQTKKGKRSHYQYKNWGKDSQGKRTAAPVYPLRRENADLINTCYYNRATGTSTVYCLQLDLDAQRADPKWLNKKGKIKRSLLLKFLRENFPWLMKYIFAITRSTSGKGVHLAIAISPLEIVDSTERAQAAATAVNVKLVQLFAENGLGADPSAIGLNRDFANWQDPSRSLFSNEHILRAVQANNERRPIVKELLDALKQYPSLGYQKKSTRDDLFYPDLRAEPKLAKLYEYARSEWADSWNGAEGVLTTAQIQEITGLSRGFLLSHLKEGFPWQKTEWLGKGEGWRLTIFFNDKLDRRARELAGGMVSPSRTPRPFSDSLKHPSEVVDGERNNWLTDALLALKHNGTDEQTAREIMYAAIKHIDGHEYSRNCKQIEQIIRSVYRNKQSFFGIKPGSAPSFLFALGTMAVPNSKQNIGETAPAKPKLHIVPKEKTITLEKGTESPFVKSGLLSGMSPRKVSLDGCFALGRNYYSVPPDYLEETVQVFEWEGRLRVYDSSGTQFLACHDKAQGKGKYVILDGHHREITQREEEYLEYLIGRLSRKGEYVSDFVQRQVDRHGVYALRRIWTLAGLGKGHSSAEVDSACSSARHLGHVKNRLEEGQGTVL